MHTPNDKFFEAPIVNPRYLNKNYPEFFEYLQSHYPNDITTAEKVYWWRNNIQTHPTCPSCGKRLRFYGVTKGYAKYCSYKCSNSSGNKKELCKQTCLEKYGAENPLQCDEIKAKSRQTCLEKYGSTNPFGSEIVQERIKVTNLEKYGVEYSGAAAEVKEKIRMSLKEKYGVESTLDLPQTKSNLIQNCKKRSLEKYKEFLDVVPGEYVVKCPHPECTKCSEKYYQVPRTVFFDRRRDKTEPCTRILPVKDKTWGSGIERDIRLILDKHNIEYICNDRSLIGPKEVDIYIPSKNIAIECNGVYTHCSIRKESSYHRNKSKLCEDQGVQLLHIWEDQIKNKIDIVESIILSKLGIYQTKIYARKCEVKYVPTKQCHQFLRDNHIQGKSNSSIKLGLYYDGELVSLMTFCQKRALSGNKKRNDGEWELIRFCNKLHTTVVGGASKLLQHFIKTMNPISIYSFSSNDISTGNLYKQLHFERSGSDDYSYWWVKNGILERFHRTEFTKDRIVEVYGWMEQNDSTWTEEEVMYQHGYFKLVDSGMKKWVLNLEFNAKS